MTAQSRVRDAVMAALGEGANPAAPVASSPVAQKPFSAAKAEEAKALFAVRRTNKRASLPVPKVDNIFAPAKHPKSVEDSASSDLMAMDSDFADVSAWGGAQVAVWASAGYYADAAREGLAFLGFPYLATLAQRSEFRRISERIATEMTRKWIKIFASGDDDLSEQVKLVEAEMHRLKARQCFRRAAEQDGFFGRGHIHMDLGTGKGRDDRELSTPIGDGVGSITEAKVTKNSLKRLVPIEAVWLYPTNYNSSDPFADNFYRPDMWNSQGRQVHASRILTFVGREVPDMLKPAYSFGGLSMTQMAMPYVDNWLRTRQAVTDLVESFSVLGLKTDMSQVLQGGGQSLDSRIDLFNLIRSNRGMLALGKDEDFFNVETSLSGLSDLQAQSQEQMAAVSGIPLVILLGIQPKGLNASSDGDIRIFYDWIAAYQEHLFSDNLRVLLRMVQLSVLGKVYDQIGFKFEPLWSLDEKSVAEKRKVEAETGQVLIDKGVITNAEERERVANEEGTPYPGLDVEQVPDATTEEADDLRDVKVDGEQDGDDEDGEPVDDPPKQVDDRRRARDKVGV